MKFKIVCITLFSSILLSCATQNANNANLSGNQNSDDLFVVDCLLPGQVRKLGQIATYMTARRAIKTSAVQCGIRGGEYVAYDRANYTTALNIWLPKAQTGDPEAQYYVGEVYEKGLGVSPDYDLAQVWYKKAASQGYSKAQLNLGYLYEKGLGVEKNQEIARKWYSKSSNLSKLDIPYAATISSADSEELSEQVKLLKAALNNSQVEAKNLKNKVATMQGRLSSSKTKLELLQIDAEKVKNKIKVRTSANSGQQETSELKQLLAEKTAEIQRQQLNVQALEDEYKKKIETLTEKLVDTKKRANQIVTELKKDHNPEQMQVALLEMEAKLAETEKRLLDENEKKLSIKDQERQLLIAQVGQGEKLNEKYLQDIKEKAEQVEKLTNKLTAEQQRYEDEIKKLQQRVGSKNNSNKPVIEIIDPPFVITRGVPTITLRSIVKQREIVGKVETSNGLLSLSINDQKIEINEQGLFKNDVKLFGNETPVSIVAVDKTGSSARVNFILSLDSGLKIDSEPDDSPNNGNWKKLDFGNYHALIIGNNEYKKVPKLETPVNDATVVEEILRNKYGFKTKLLINGTRYQILSELNKLRSQLTEADNLLIYYAGHGELDKVNMRGHWLPVDADGDNSANWISTVAITDILNSMSIKHILVVSDSCYSGAMTRSSLARLDSGTTGKKRDDWLKAMLKTRSRTVLTSGGLKPVMDGGGGNHSVFAKAFIDTLKNNNSLLEGQSLYRSVSEGIVSVASRYGIDQVPEYAPIRFAGHESGEFFFVPKS